ncbi:hypothetical protein BZG36_01450 [Bifiguratus adelaidae]|uniref:VHS domain-containing protein n=1 Tax=Bifiguratus adelaidae TaxID=1938954 RepID=A0A261Y511_9FUNG|nr:hypothetical protein BZG36_01450 [Bifiguratus adelaidae]
MKGLFKSKAPTTDITVNVDYLVAEEHADDFDRMVTICHKVNISAQYAKEARKALQYRLKDANSETKLRTIGLIWQLSDNCGRPFLEQLCTKSFLNDLYQMATSDVFSPQIRHETNKLFAHWSTLYCRPPNSYIIGSMHNATLDIALARSILGNSVMTENRWTALAKDIVRTPARREGGGPSPIGQNEMAGNGVLRNYRGTMVRTPQYGPRPYQHPPPQVDIVDVDRAIQSALDHAQLLRQTMKAAIRENKDIKADEVIRHLYDACCEKRVNMSNFIAMNPDCQKIMDLIHAVDLVNQTIEVYTMKMIDYDNGVLTEDGLDDPQLMGVHVETNHTEHDLDEEGWQNYTADQVQLNPLERLLLKGKHVAFDDHDFESLPGASDTGGSPGSVQDKVEDQEDAAPIEGYLLPARPAGKGRATEQDDLNDLQRLSLGNASPNSKTSSTKRAQSHPDSGDAEDPFADPVEAER